MCKYGGMQSWIEPLYGNQFRIINYTVLLLNIFIHISNSELFKVNALQNMMKLMNRDKCMFMSRYVVMRFQHEPLYKSFANLNPYH